MSKSKEKEKFNLVKELMSEMKESGLKKESLGILFKSPVIDTLLGLHNPSLTLVFGAGRFPITYFFKKPIGGEEDIISLDKVLYNIATLKKRLPLEICLKYNELARLHQPSLKHALPIRIPVNLSGICTKNKDVCRATLTHRFSCGGCGKIYIPDSYESKNCNTDMKKPFWYMYLKGEMIHMVEETGGVHQDTPLILNQNGYMRE